jgi:hypothetical protein
VTAGGARRRAASAPTPVPAPAVVLRGGPTLLAALRPPSADLDPGDPTGRRSAAAVALHIEGLVPERVHVRGRRDPDAPAQLRVRLAPSTPPGRYEGEATVGGKTVPVVIEVEPAPRVRAAPARFAVTAEPAGSGTVEVELANTGNVPVEIPARSSFCLFDGGGIDHAVWAALTAEPPEGKGRMDLLLDDLATSHGGLVDVRVRAGAGALAPGERRTCQVELGWSDRLRPGRTYAGSWEVGGLRLPIRVETPRSKGPATPAPAISRRAR